MDKMFGKEMRISGVDNPEFEKSLCHRTMELVAMSADGVEPDSDGEPVITLRAKICMDAALGHEVRCRVLSGWKATSPAIEAVMDWLPEIAIQLLAREEGAMVMIREAVHMNEN